ncbi:MAG: hypothetical protein NTV09_10705 [Bacteroidetes bacterium]|nr:hypothetical protein [Bacteroidota bacterium]
MLIFDKDEFYKALTFSFELIFYLKGNVRMEYSDDNNGFIQEKSFYSGQFTKSFKLHFGEPCKCVGVSFYPWVGNLLYGMPAQHFTGQMIPVHCIERNSELYGELLVAKNNTELFGALERYLEKRLSGLTEDEMVSAVTKRI